jgi:hypothetical protein
MVSAGGGEPRGDAPRCPSPSATHAGLAGRGWRLPSAGANPALTRFGLSPWWWTISPLEQRFYVKHSLDLLRLTVERPGLLRPFAPPGALSLCPMEGALCLA